MSDLDDLVQLAASILADTCPNTATDIGGNAADTLRPVIAALLDEAASRQWIQKHLDEIGIRSADFRNGVEMQMEPARELLAHWVAAARTMLGDAPNYTETRVSMDIKVAESPEIYTLVVQRHGPGVLTPHEARQHAEARVAELETLIVDLTAMADGWTKAATAGRLHPSYAAAATRLQRLLTLYKEQHQP